MTRPKPKKLDPNWFPFSKIPDLARQLQGRTIDRHFIISIQEKLNPEKFNNKVHAHIPSLEDWMGLERGEILRRYRPELEGVR
jgi:hypothetical protein